MRIFSSSVPKSQFAYALFLAGRQHASREHWLLRARGTVEDRSLYVSYAKSAHQAYLGSMKLVKELNARSLRRIPDVPMHYAAGSKPF